MTKKKLIISLCAFALVVCIGIVGVLAATQATAGISTTVGFQAIDVVADASFTCSNNGTNVATKTWNFYENTDTNTSKYAVDAQTFAESAGAYIEYRFVIENKGDKAFKVVVTATPTSVDNVTITTSLKVGATEATADTALDSATAVTKGQFVVYTYRMALQDITKNVSSSVVDINILLNAEA